MLYLSFWTFEAPHDDVLSHATVILSYAFHPANDTCFIPVILDTTRYALARLAICHVNLPGYLKRQLSDSSWVNRPGR